MKKGGIKVIKKLDKNEKERRAALTIVPFAKKTEMRGMTNAVNIWISERTENRRVEKDFSDVQIRKWKSAEDLRS